MKVTVFWKNYEGSSNFVCDSKQVNDKFCKLYGTGNGDFKEETLINLNEIRFIIFNEE
jgi:hypothetical protein